MAGQRVVSGVVLNERVSFSLSELCGCCDVSAEYVIELVDEGVVLPLGGQPAQWRFRGDQIKRVQMAVRLAEDLRLNLPGVALALELMDELDELRRLQQRARRLEDWPG